MADELIDGESRTELESVLLGRRIVAVDESAETLTLDNGDVLTVEPNYGGCSCGAGDYELSSLATCDNAIMRVEVRQTDIGEEDWETTERLSIFVYAEGLTAEVVSVVGDEGNGYYGRGFNIRVTRAA